MEQEIILIYLLGIAAFGLMLATIGPVIIEIVLNPILCLFSRKMRYRRWNGYSGIGYTDRPLLTRKGALFINFLEENGTDIHTEIRKARNGKSEYFIDSNTYKL